jgi:hypothetical protein
MPRAAACAMNNTVSAVNNTTKYTLLSAPGLFFFTYVILTLFEAGQPAAPILLLSVAETWLDSLDFNMD